MQGLSDNFEIGSINFSQLEKQYDFRGHGCVREEVLESYADNMDECDLHCYDYSESTGVVVYPECYKSSDADAGFDFDLGTELTQAKLGRCVDFGCGIRRKHCYYQKCVEHVEVKRTLALCSCGSNIVPRMSDFQSSEIDTFIAINSLQNNPLDFQEKMLGKIKSRGWGFLISVPVKLGFKEYDTGEIIFQLFPEVVVTQYKTVRFYRYVRPTVEYVGENEIVVTAAGNFSEQRRNGSYRFVACVVVFENEIYGVDIDKGPLDFPAAGHLRYGETVMAGMRREWLEEMISPLPEFQLLGRVDSLNNKDLTFIFLTEVDSPVCIPSRGRIVKLNLNYRLRHQFQMALEIMKPLRKWSVDISTLAKNHFRHRVRQKFYSGVDCGQSPTPIKKGKRRRGDKTKLSKVEENEAIKNALGEIKVYSNVSWFRVSVLNYVEIGYNIMVDLMPNSKPVETILVQFLGNPLGFAKLVHVGDDKLTYRVFEVFQLPNSTVKKYVMFNTNTYPNPIKVVMLLYNMGLDEATRVHTANKGVIPVFVDDDDKIESSSNGVFLNV